MEYIKIKDGKISSYRIANEIPEGGIAVHDFKGLIGDPVTFYTADWKRKTNEELYREGLLPVPTGYRLNSAGKLVRLSFKERLLKGYEKIPLGWKINAKEDDIEPMSAEECITAGIKELPKGMKWNEDKTELIPMTVDEQYATGAITEDEWREYKCNQLTGILNAIDSQSIRALRSILSGLGTDKDRAKLADLELFAQSIREKLSDIQK